MVLKYLKPVFTKRIPEELDSGIMYVCIEGKTMMHLCPCVCGKIVVLSLDRTFWSFKYDGENISIFPSIGNYQFPCKSHYWIIDNCIVWDSDLKNDVFSKNRVQKLMKRIKHLFGA